MSSHRGRRGHTDASCRRVFCAEHKQGCSSGLTHPHIHMATFSVNAFTKELESIISVKLMNLGHFSKSPSFEVLHLVIQNISNAFT